jgi:putative endonuclease
MQYNEIGDTAIERFIMSEDLPWWLYILECKDGAFYTGIAIDVDARYRQHCEGKGARYTRMNPPVRIVAKKSFPDRGSAASAEALIKRLPRPKKIELMESWTKSEV